MNKIMIRLIALLLCGVLLLGLISAVLADEEAGGENTVYISSTEDLLEFAENCRLDSYSQGLTVYLTADIDLADTGFSGIPIFSGTFVGGGKIISGMELTGEGSYQGLFRYLTETAAVSGLTVSGNAAPGGSRSYVGGIAGSNAGTITDCVFAGDVSGVGMVGGLVGVNEIGGTIENCRFEGNAHGDHFVGGIAGMNYGVIRSCTNEAEVNTTQVQNSVDLEDISVGSLTGTESSVTITDIGGIAGFNSGIIAECVNQGPVGYQYMGYNIGGIAGVNTGYVSECSNLSRVYGRKEVGGIVGQLEPYTTLVFSTDALQILQAQVEDLQNVISTVSVHMKENYDQLSALVAQLEQYVADLEEAVGHLSSIVGDPQIENLKDAAATVEAIARLVQTISDCLTGINATVSKLYSAIKDTGSDLESDLAAISAQVDLISSTLDNASEDLGGTVIDASDKDTEALTSSEVSGCINQGEVLGDLNVGGIVGAIAVENDLDPEEDIDILGDATLNYDAEIRSVITYCVNTAEVQGRKQRIGGIVGWMSLGLAKNCANIGTVTAASADYVGGVAGVSEGFIRGSDARCLLSGDAYVGGIAGSAEVVSDCVSLVQIVEGTEKLGSIIGYAEEREEICGNAYLIAGADLGGIDGISYSGVAESVELDAFLKMDLPEVFRTVTLRFSTDDNFVDVTVDLGDELTDELLPAIPAGADGSGYWDGLGELDRKHIYFDEEFTAVYDVAADVIQGDLVSNDRPVMLAVGQFASNQTMKVEELTVEDALAGWSFSFPQGGTVSALHLLLEEYPAEEVIVMLRNSQTGEWSQASFEQKGSYLVISTDDSNDAVCLMPAPADHTLLVVVIIAAGVLAVTCLVIVIVHKNRKKKAK